MTDFPAADHGAAPPDLGGEFARIALELDDAPAERVIAWAFDRFPRVAIVASFQAESSVLIDMACRLRPDVDIVTLDTGRLPAETHELIDQVQSRYPVRLHAVAPDAAEVEDICGEHGVNLFRRSQELRHLCCGVRKVRPLARALTNFDAWITGLRRDQSSTRQATPVVQSDAAHGGIAKIAPLAGWTGDDVWRYLRDHDVPHHALYDQHYTSIGCAPCTRATRPGEDARAGRWWWEHDEIKECGLHWAASGTGTVPVPIRALPKEDMHG